MLRGTLFKTFLSTGVIFVLLLITHYLGWLKMPENTIREFLIPLFSKTHGLSIKAGEKYEFFQNKEEFFNTYNQCVIKSEQIDVLETRNNLLTQENIQLKKQVLFTEGTKIKSLTTQVIGADIIGTEKTILVNSGSKQGVRIGNPVTSETGIFIGKVIKTEDNIAIVRLLNHYQSRIQATILNTDQSLGVIEGGYGGNIRMQFVPRNEKVAINDQVVTSGFETSTPRGLVIGRVIEVENEAYQGFQKITVVPTINLSKLTIVSILLTEDSL